jgi:phosphopantetheinyl transferase
VPLLIRPGEVQLILDSSTTSARVSAVSKTGLVLLEPDVHGRPRGQDAQGRSLAISQARAPGAQILAIARGGRIGVDLELLQPSQALEAASELFLPTERDWAESVPSGARWQRFLALWTVKEALLKALGQGFSYGMDQIELGSNGEGGIALRRLCGSERLAQGWCIEVQEHNLEGRTYLMALARTAPGGVSEGA